MLAVLADELPNEPYLVALQAVDAQDAIFCAFYMDLCGLQVELIGAQIDQFGDSQGMSIRASRSSNRSRTGLRDLPAVVSSFSISGSVRVPGLSSKAAHVKQHIRDKLIEHRNYVDRIKAPLRRCARDQDPWEFASRSRAEHSAGRARRADRAAPYAALQCRPQSDGYYHGPIAASPKFLDSMFPVSCL